MAEEQGGRSRSCSRSRATSCAGASWTTRWSTSSWPATKHGSEARLLTNLGNALLAQGRHRRRAARSTRSATEADPTLAARLFNLAKLYCRRAAALPDEAVGVELDKAHTA